MDKRLVRMSKILSLVLRHEPEAIGLALDPAGWASVPDLIRSANQAGHRLTPELLREVVAKNDKQRFTFSADGLRIRAAQGHSLPVDLGLAPIEPPKQLYHGTACHQVETILREGLVRGRRQHVHLSPDPETAVRVGRRHGEPIVLAVDSGSMHEQGFTFHLSDNRVWLTQHVPARFLRKLGV